jgi:hypothetical protein
MAQDLTVNIKTTSDVPQAMEKAKAATNSFNKQVEDIGKKFSTSFKDIFLSFLGPMALLTGAIAFIGKLIADNQKKQQEANQAAIDDTNKLMSAEDKYWANKRNNEKTSKETVEQAETQRTTTTKEFLESDPRGQEIVKREKQKVGNVQQSFMGINDFFKIYTNKKIQDEVQGIIAEDLKKNPGAGINPDAKSDTFKGPQGFGSVIGVGANPVIEAMTKQTEVLLEIKKVLENQAPGGGVPPPFTEKPMSTRNIFNA